MSYGEAAYGEVEIAGSPDLDSFAFIEMLGAIGDTTVSGPAFYTDPDGDIIEQPGVFVPALALEVAPRSDLANVDTTVMDATFGRSFFDEFNDTGSGQFAYANTDLAVELALDGAGDADGDLDAIVTFKVWGVRAFSMLVETQVRVPAAEGEEHDQTTAVVGRGHLCVCDESVLFPSRGTGILPIEEDRTFNWSTPSPVYDDSGWASAYQICTVATAQVVWPWLPFAQDWPDLTAGVIWASGSTITDAPVGFCYFRKDFTLAQEGFYLLYAACDNDGELWLDGQLVLNLGDFQQSYSYVVFMSAGDHTVAVRGENWTQWSGYVNPAGFIFALYIADAANQPATLILHSDSTWKIVAYPASPPGMYVGDVLRVGFQEAYDRLELLDVELMFTSLLDSAGNPWPETVDISTKVGTSYLVWLIELTSTYIDVWMKPGTFELYCWNKGTRPAPSEVVMHTPSDPDDPETGNIYEQAHTVLL